MPRLRLVAATLVALLVATAALAGDPAPTLPPDPATLAEMMKSKLKSDRLDGATKAKDDPAETLTTPLIALLDDDDLSIRHAAIEALGARTSLDTQKKAAAALASHLPRLSKKIDTQVELISACQALGTLAQPTSIPALAADMGLDTPVDVIRARLDAIANIPCAEAIDELITFLAKQGRGQMGIQRQACRKALKEATGQDLGNEADSWRSWWKDAKKDFDFDAAARRRDSAKAAAEDKETRRREAKEKREKGPGDAKKGEPKKEDEPRKDGGEEKKDDGSGGDGEKK